MNYVYGEQIKYSIDLLGNDDYLEIQNFSCGNDPLDFYIHNDLIKSGIIDVEDGLPFKVTDNNSGKIIALYSLAASGLTLQVDSYTHVLPAIKINIFAVDTAFQKMHMNEFSKSSDNPDDHYYFCDCVMCDVVNYCRELSEKHLAVNYIILYADKKARRFYERNLFNDFSEYMQKERNMEIKANDPMFLSLN